MKPPPFAYHRAASVEEATALLADLGDGARVLAGGQSLMPLLNLRTIRPTALVDVNRIPGLDVIADEPDRVRIGALSRHRQLEVHDGGAGGLAVLARAARWIGHVAIRSWGTIGGSLAHADPAAEWCLLAVALDAQVEVRSARERRTLPTSELFAGPLRTTLGPDELLTGVTFGWRPDRAGFAEHSRRPGGPALVSAAVAYDVVDGVVRSPHVGVGGAQIPIRRVPEAEAALEGRAPEERRFREAGAEAAAAVEEIAGADEGDRYLQHLVRHLVPSAGADAERVGRGQT